MNKRFPRKAFPPGTLMIYEESDKNHMFIVTETTNDGKINVIPLKKNNVIFFLTNNFFRNCDIRSPIQLFWNCNFDTNVWKFILPRKNNAQTR